MPHSKSNQTRGMLQAGCNNVVVVPIKLFNAKSARPFESLI